MMPSYVATTTNDSARTAIGPVNRAARSVTTATISGQSGRRDRRSGPFIEVFLPQGEGKGGESSRGSIRAARYPVKRGERQAVRGEGGKCAMLNDELGKAQRSRGNEKIERILDRQR